MDDSNQKNWPIHSNLDLEKVELDLQEVDQGKEELDGVPMSQECVAQDLDEDHEDVVEQKDFE